MMSSSPPPNGSSGFNHYASANPNQLYNLTSSPSYNDGLNLQLQNMDTSLLPQGQMQTQNYTTRENIPNESPANMSHSDNSLIYEHHTHQHVLDTPQQQQELQQQQQQHQHQMQQHDLLAVEMQQQHSQLSQHSQHSQQLPHIEIHSTPQFNHIQEPINESEYEDFVPISSNMDPNLQFPSSASYAQLNSSATSSFNSNYFPQSMSGNSLSSHLTQTPSQHSRRLSATAMHNMTSTPSQTPIRKQNNFVTPRVVGPNGIAYSHKRSKSKVAIEKSPATGNPFYNPPSFLSPKVSKKSHKKTISITNSISLTHLDTDLNIQQMHQLGRSGSPSDTPLRTPGRRNDIRYMYGNDEDNEDDDYDDEDDEYVHQKYVHGGNDGDDYAVQLARNMMVHNSQLLMGSSINQQSADDVTVNINDGTFIMPNVLMKHKFGDKLMQSSNDLNNVLTDTLDPEVETSSMFENMSSGNYASYLNGVYIPESSTVESLPNDIFSYSSNDKSVSDSYYDTLDHEAQQKQKYQYNKRPSLPQPQEQQQQHIHQQHQQHLLHQQQLQQPPHRYSEPSPVVLKASSVPQTRTGSTSVESKIQRSGSSFNLSNIAAYKEGKIQDHYRYTRSSMMNYTDPSPPQSHSHQSYSVFDQNDEYESSPHLNNNMITPINTAPTSSNIPISTSISLNASTSTSGSIMGGNNNIGSSGSGIKASTSLQEVAEARNKEVLLPHSSSNKTLLESPTAKTRSRSKRTSFTLTDIRNPEKLDLPQQSARSRSRSKKNLHDEKKVHECPLCHMKFQRPEHVKRHMLSHSSEKPFECTEEGCNKRFNRNDNLKQHLRNIHKKKV